MTIVTIAFKKPTPMPKHFALPPVKENVDLEKMEKMACCEENLDNEPKIEILCWHIIVAIFIASSCFVVAFTSYQDRHAARQASLVTHYKGFCTIPVDTREKLTVEESAGRVPLQWSPDDDVQVFGAVHDLSHLGNALREKLDISDSMEVISVFNNGRSIKFIHDFTENTTGIVDDERCFTMELDPDVVLEPVMFVMGIDGGKDFDITRLRTKMEAVLPALDAMSKPHALAENCADKPTYKLERSEVPALRKRSTDLPASDYVQFSGKHVQEIAINNLQLIIDQERNNKAN